MEGQAKANQTVMAAVSGRHARNRGGTAGQVLLQRGRINGTDGVGPGPHGGGIGGRGGIGTSYAVLASPTLTQRDTTGALTTIARTSGGSSCLVEFLLVTQEQVAPGKASFALGALERLLLGVGALVPLQMFEPSKGPLTGGAYMWARLVSLGRRELARARGWRCCCRCRRCFDSDGGSFYETTVC